jgi:hypothetical protein
MNQPDPAPILAGLTFPALNAALSSHLDVKPFEFTSLAPTAGGGWRATVTVEAPSADAPQDLIQRLASGPMQGVVANHTEQNEAVARSRQIPSERRNILRRQFQAEAASAELQADRALEEQLCNPGWPERPRPAGTGDGGFRRGAKRQTARRPLADGRC